MGRDHEANVPRGVAPANLLREHGVLCSIATNNVLNPFTPFGDCSLIRMANLYANVAQLGRPREIASCLDMVTTDAARLMNLADYGIAVDNPADLLVLDAESSFSAVAELVRPLAGFKAGRKSFEVARARLCPPPHE
jgi:cytosine/creatinine deaminase